MESTTPEIVFPRLDADEIALVRSIAHARVCVDGEVVVEAGKPDADLIVIEAGNVDVIDAAHQGAVIATHGPGEFAGDIDLVTGRPVVFGVVARGSQTRILCVGNRDFRTLLNTIPRLAEKFMGAIRARRELLNRAGVVGVRVIGPAADPHTTLIREFLFRNFVPFVWIDPEREESKPELANAALSGVPLPAVICAAGRVIGAPELLSVAKCVGLRRAVPDRVYDLAVVGAGPAGLAAAVYAASEGLSVIVLDRLGPGGQAAGSSLIENFIGFPEGLSGAELAERGTLQMLKFGATLLVPADVVAVLEREHSLTLLTGDGEAIRARYVLAASGVCWRRLNARGAERFERRGVYYAATIVESRSCAGQDIVVVGGGNSGGQAAMFLSECSRRVHLILRTEELTGGMSEYLARRIGANERIRVHPKSEVVTVLGAKSVEAVEVRNTESNQVEKVPCGAVFVFIGAEPHTEWLPATVKRNADGYLLTGPDAQRDPAWPLERDPCPLETTLPRVLAAGDIRSGATKRVGFAVGDGALAVTCVHRLRKEEEEEGAREDEEPARSEDRAGTGHAPSAKGVSRSSEATPAHTGA